MKFNNKLKLLLASLFVLICIGYFFTNSVIGEDKSSNLKTYLSEDQKQTIKKYLFPFKLISLQRQKIIDQDKRVSELEELFYQLELDFKKSGKNIGLIQSKIKLSNNKNLNKYKLKSGFYHGIANEFPGSGYIDFFENNIFILSSRGVLVYRNEDLKDDNFIFKQIDNNINEFIDSKQFGKKNWFSLKDLLISDGKIFVSYTEEISEDCWNTSLLLGNFNYENIQFEKLFSPKECIHSKNNIDNEFNGHQSGGRIISFDDNHILFSVGEYRSRFLAQDVNSVNGKIIKINYVNNNYEIISMGHRNPQGLFFDKENNFILETEHGPTGGDEINLIEVKDINNNKIPNYGWAIASEGSIEKSYNLKYEKYPLYNSHSEHGFIEPLKSYTPSIGISEIVKIGDNNEYVVSSLKDSSLYFFELNEEKKIINMERIEVFERIRDIKFYDKKLYLFMEDSASIGLINIY